MGRNNGDFRTEYDSDSKTFMTPAAKQQKDGWVSPWPQGHPNRTEYVSPAQQTANVNNSPEGRQRTANAASQAKQAKDGWVSPWPVGHPNHTEMVK